MLLLPITAVVLLYIVGASVLVVATWITVANGRPRQRHKTVYRRGPQGPQGQSGENGPAGENGPQGDAGSQGSQGPQGNEGLQGSDGATVQFQVNGTPLTVNSPVNFLDGDGILITNSSAGNIVIAADPSAFVTSINANGGANETGDITLQNGNNITITDTPAGTCTIALNDPLLLPSNERITTYLRIGSLAVPVNITPGDLTAIRMALNTALPFSPVNGEFMIVEGTMPETSGIANGTVRSMTATSATDPTTATLTAAVNRMSTALNIGMSFTGRVIGDNASAVHQGSADVVNLIGQLALTQVAGASFVGAATITNAIGLQAIGMNAVGSFTTGNVQNAIGVQVIDSDLGSGPNLLTTQVGVDVRAQTRGTTDNIGLRIETPSGATNNFALQFVTGTTAAAGITWSNDTNLYRSAANTLRTDDTFSALHFLCNSGTPTVGSFGTGAGNATGRVAIITGNDAGLQLSLTPGAGPTGGAAGSMIVQINFNVPYSSAVNAVIVTPGNLNAAALTSAQAVWISATAVGSFTLTSGVTALAAAPVTYVWNFSVRA